MWERTRTPRPCTGQRLVLGHRASSYRSPRVEAVNPGGCSSNFWTAARGRGGQKICASEPGLTSGAGCPHGRLGDPATPWGGRLVALTLIPETQFPILPARGDDPAPQPGQVCEPSVAPGPGGLGTPLRLHHGNAVPPGGCGGSSLAWTAHAAHWPPRAGAEAGRGIPGARVSAVRAARSADGRARQAGSRGLLAGPGLP